MLDATTKQQRGCISNFVPSLPPKCATNRRTSSSTTRISGSIVKLTKSQYASVTRPKIEPFGQNTL
eukprot:4454904-Amphidinium_carterae.1